MSGHAGLIIDSHVININSSSSTPSLLPLPYGMNYIRIASTVMCHIATGGSFSSPPVATTQDFILVPGKPEVLMESGGAMVAARAVSGAGEVSISWMAY